mgnify:CR=1 FL=1
MTMRSLIFEEIDEVLPTRMLDYPLSRQSSAFSCGAAVVQSLLHYYDVKDTREEEIIDAMGTNPKDGTNIKAMVKYLNKNGLKTKETANTKLESVKKWINSGHPIVVSLQAWGEDEEPDYSQNKDSHYVVAIGYSNTSIFFEDPSLLGNRGFLTNEELEQRWHDEDSTHKAIFVYGLRPNYDSKKAKRIG